MSASPLEAIVRECEERQRQQEYRIKLLEDKLRQAQQALLTIYQGAR